MVKVSVAGNGALIPDGAGGVIEWVKAEDLERMQTYTDYGNEESAPSEESYDIF
jgi:penicillin-binding protein 1A